jgi:molybdopterin molybdotransferase
MKSVDESLAIMLAAARPLPPEEVDLAEACGRVLAQEVCADRDLPPFDKSAVDGWACRRAELGLSLRRAGVVAAGSLPEGPLAPGTCVKVMTGAMVPAGSECVVMVEDCVEAGDQVRLGGRSADNICRQGEDLCAGQAVLGPGIRIGPAEIAVLATCGVARPLVARRPRVAVIATGSELVEPHQTPGPATIRDSNSWQLRAQLQVMGAEVRRLGIVEDREEALLAAVRETQAWGDLTVLSGGVSMGDFDLVPGVLEACGFQLLFDSVAMQPGRPTVFGDDGRGWCVGLPGNPVSTFVICGLLVHPFLDRLQGRRHAALPIRASLVAAVRRRRAERQATIPVAFTAPGQVEAIDYHGSAHIDALTRAHGFISLPVGISELAAGSEVDVRLL